MVMPDQVELCLTVTELQGIRPAPEHEDELGGPCIVIPVIDLDGRHVGDELHTGEVMLPMELQRPGLFTAAPAVLEHFGIKVPDVGPLEDQVQDWVEVHSMALVLKRFVGGEPAYVRYRAGASSRPDGRRRR